MLPPTPPNSEKQVARHLLMVRPARFGANPQTAESNAFQQELPPEEASEVALLAQKEFDLFVAKLRDAGVTVTVAEDSVSPLKPDALFPNNWVSFHGDGRVVLYPMLAPMRRRERNPGFVQQVVADWPYHELIDLSGWEAEEEFLESTGSMCLDRMHRIAYACRSPRTTPRAFEDFCVKMGYEGMMFDSVDQANTPIYHANVMMAVGERLAVICLESIPDFEEREKVNARLEATGHEVVAITQEQVLQFAGNMLEVEGTQGKRWMVMSQRAAESLTPLQVATISQWAEPLVIPLDVIEVYGGGSVRCMMAEVFSPEEN